MQVGKLPMELLSRLLSQVEITDPRVVLGPKLGEDAALIDLGDRLLVAKTDPITFATDLIGWYAVQINANDLASMGAKPLWFMATLLLPEETTPKQVEAIFGQLIGACRDLDIALIGGHTEVTYQLPRPIIVGAMLGEVAKDRVVLTSGAQPGDSVVLTKGVAIEGTAVLAREAEGALLEAGVKPEVIARAKEFLFKPGISVVTEAQTACQVTRVHSMHDPTEGGLATGLLEIAKGAQVGVMIDEGSIPVLPECEAICRALGLNPLGLLASGGLILTLSPEEVPKLLSALGNQGIPAFEIGQITPKEEGLKMKRKDAPQDLPLFDRDELARFFSTL